MVHYGNANVVNITAVKFGTYKENGSVGTMNIKAGKVEISEDAFIGKIAVDKDATAGDGTVASDVAIVNNGSVFAAEVIEYNATNYEHTASSAESAIVDQVEEEIISSSDKIQVGTAEALMNLAFAQSTGLITGNDGVFNIELTKDIDLTGKTWVPFGAEREGETFRFAGTIDGNKHTITGLSNGDYKGKIVQNNTTSIVGEKYGFIAWASGEKSVTVKNITFDKVNINAPNASNCGVVIGNAGGEHTEGSTAVKEQSLTKTTTLDHVTVNGKIVGKDKVGGLVGYLFNYYTNTTVSNCNVNVDISLAGDGYRAGGLFGQIANGFNYVNPQDQDINKYKANLYVDGCSYNGKISIGDSTNNKARFAAISYFNSDVSRYTNPEAANARSRIYVTNFTTGLKYSLDYKGITDIGHFYANKQLQEEFSLATAILCHE